MFRTVISNMILEMEKLSKIKPLLNIKTGFQELILEIWKLLEFELE